MADVLVKGVKMPKRCYDCPFCETEGYITCLCTPDWKDIGKMTWIKRRPSWCPLVEVPEPHGDLVDRNDLLLEIENYPRSCGIIREEIEAEIKELPTILEASK